jgi:hypothetical protein
LMTSLDVSGHPFQKKVGSIKRLAAARLAHRT